MDLPIRKMSIQQCRKVSLIDAQLSNRAGNTVLLDLLADQFNNSITDIICRNAEVAGSEEAGGVQSVIQAAHQEEIEMAHADQRLLQRPLDSAAPAKNVGLPLHSDPPNPHDPEASFRNCPCALFLRIDQPRRRSGRLDPRRLRLELAGNGGHAEQLYYGIFRSVTPPWMA